MHPLLLSLTNIHTNICMKATSHTFTLTTYLPIPKFLKVSSAVQLVLSACVYHFVISTVMQNLKVAEKNGVIISDSNGLLWVVHTPLVSWNANSPEQHVISCISSKYFLVFTASTEYFGEATPSPIHCHQVTFVAIRKACLLCDACDITTLHKVCLSSSHLNGMVVPFWVDWGDVCPLIFLTPNTFHQ